MAATDSINFGDSFVYGIVEPKPLHGLPENCQKVRLRLRNDEFASAFVKLPDRIVECYIKNTRAGTWELGVVKASNVVGQAALPDQPSLPTRRRRALSV